MMLFQSGKSAAVLFFMSALFFGDLFGSASVPVIPNVKNPPPMDGKFDAKQWQGALELKLRTLDGKSYPREPGIILLRRDATTRYIAVVMKAIMYR